MRVVLYAEGTRELGASTPVPPLTPIDRSEEGAGHVLVRRALSALGCDEIVFEGPLLGRRGRPLRGSELLETKPLRRVLTWARGRPDLAIVLVDRDGNSRRKRQLEAILDKLDDPVDVVAAVAREEFESWLVADVAALSSVARAPLDELPKPESMKPGRAKAILEQTVRQAAQDREAAWSHRKAIAERVDLDKLRKRCPSFAAFQKDLRAKLA